MSTRPDQPNLEALLAHARWLQRLARHLVHQPVLADDLVQDAWEATLSAPPDPDRPARPWLAQVLRNLVRMHGRGEARRRTREQLAAPAEALPAADVLLERMELQRLVAGRVMKLEEPFRSTLLLCFYEGLAPSEIARRSGIPAGTVRWRLKAAIERVRRDLDDQHGGDRRAWQAALLPLAGPSAQGQLEAGRPGGPGTGVLPASFAGLTLAAAIAGVALFGLSGAEAEPARAPEAATVQAAPRTATELPASGAAAVAPRDRTEVLRDAGKALGMMLPALLSASAQAVREVSRDQAIDACVDRRERVFACQDAFADAFAASSPLLGSLGGDSLRAMVLREIAQDGAGPLDDRRERCARAVDQRIPATEGDLEQLQRCFSVDDCRARATCALPVMLHLKQPR